MKHGKDVAGMQGYPIATQAMGPPAPTGEQAS